MQKRTKFSFWYFIIILGWIILLESLFFSKPSGKEITYSHFRNLIASDSLKSVVIETDKIYGMLKSTKADSAQNKQGSLKSTPASTPQKSAKQKNTKGEAKMPDRSKTPWRLPSLFGGNKKQKAAEKNQFTVVRLADDSLLSLLQKHNVSYKGKLQSNFLKNLFYNWIIPFGLLFLVWGFLFRNINKGPGVMNIGKSKAKIFEADPAMKVTFKEVAGIDEAVEEIQEVVNFLKSPQKFTRLGAKLPKGVLLVGPPGTGKTLLARAVAGEADVPFFNLSGSDFVEMFVGVGAARVRDLFLEAKAKAPCIIFIDELDAIGKSRGSAMPYGGGGYDERENTLNQLLVEMDGFDPKLGIVLMGATNRPEVLDLALMRPGRFDRQILVDRPDLNGRRDIFAIHSKALPLGRDVDLRKLAAQTPGFVGADIANVCNEAALLASRKEKKTVGMNDFQDAIERVIAGLEKKNKLINPHERKIVAFHESGHAIVGYFTAGADPVQKVSIVPRGIGALGYTLQTPLEDRYLMSKSELLGKIKGLLGGRAAEEITFGEISTGASNDLEKATKIARDMITIYGMSKKLPNISLINRTPQNFLAQEIPLRQHSEKMEELLDDEILEIIQECYEQDKSLLLKNKDKLGKMANTLLKKEKIGEKEIKGILGARAPQPVMGNGKPV